MCAACHDTRYIAVRIAGSGMVVYVRCDRCWEGCDR